MRRMVARALDTSTFRGRVAQALRDAVSSSGLKNDAIAEKLGVSEVYVSKCLSGQKNMTLDKVNEFMQAVGHQIPIF